MRGNLTAYIPPPQAIALDYPGTRSSQSRAPVIMHTLKVGDVTITSIIERDGPWRKPEDMFPAYDAVLGRRHLAELDPVVFDPASGRMVITYQTFLVRTPKHTVLIDTCTGEDKGYPPPFDFPKQPWLDNFKAAGVGFMDITHVFCTHLHIDHTGWNTMLRNIPGALNHED